MKLNIQKTATACGLFASGLIAGYTASRLANPFKKHLMAVNLPDVSLLDIRITPTIPKFDTDTSMDDLGLDLAMNE
ncbi:hypothetical protein [Rhodohalobacter sp. 8-1]|uniref:hypothetical protein n=1 Tax=Rhodohalobacter sp. 8-1 TaxID=3131972 RepID=UPI0030EBF2BD